MLPSNGASRALHRRLTRLLPDVNSAIGFYERRYSTSLEGLLELRKAEALSMRTRGRVRHAQYSRDYVVWEYLERLRDHLHEASRRFASEWNVGLLADRNDEGDPR